MKRTQVAKIPRQPRISNSFKDSYSYSLKWPVTGYDTMGIFRTPQFQLCGSTWSLNVYPLGVDNTGEFFSVHLISLSEEAVRVSYGFTLKNHRGEDCVWTDPEDQVLFSIADGNNEWGVDELIPLSDLAANSGFVHDSQLTIVVTITVYDRDDLNSHDSLSTAIENAGEKSDLIKLANEDLADVVSKLPVKRNLKAQKTQEDKIVVVRGGK